MGFRFLPPGGLTLAQEAELLFRIVLAGLLGAVIGVERSRRLKDAGIRTHALVGCAACLMMVVSKYGFSDIENIFPGARTADPSRVAAQIVSGVSFLGAGIIYRDRKHITRGLTTAAGVWAVAGVGMAVGSGLYFIGLATAAFILLLQFVTHRISLGSDRYLRLNVDLVLENDQTALTDLKTYMDSAQIDVLESNVTREGGKLLCSMEVRISKRGGVAALHEYMLGNPKFLSITTNEEA